MATQQESKYQELHPDGIYKLKVIGNTLGESNEKHTPFVALKVEVLGLKKAKDGKQHQIKVGAHRIVKLWLTPNTIEKAKAFLQAAGFKKGMSLSQLNPEHPQHFSLVGYECDGSNKQEKIEQGKYAGKMTDRFDVFAPKDPNAWMAKLNTANSAKVLALDAIFNSAPDFSSAASKTPAQITREVASTPKAIQQKPADDDIPPFGPDPGDDDFTW